MHLSIEPMGFTTSSLVADLTREGAVAIAKADDVSLVALHMELTEPLQLIAD